MSDPQQLGDAPAGDPLLLTPEEAARLLRVGRTTVYALMKAGELRPVHIGRSCRLARAELERFVHRLQEPSALLPRPRSTSAATHYHGPGRPLRARSQPADSSVTCG
ncbi:hypothetical protein DQ238_12005 [Geodermatophilus sp. TF02-6]|uniref:helix-turn-helix domain-containing protein n=1 Tax=Geodermatophilus sp. TF02-6 TaxID=2250575 RepID=UPI000DEAB9A3|nr:helix-turn-helix domain-containing protein [Geodermatophilus sp. TF02-6]RBY78776.1 hypothetical protein DQ238_12005 [Geodermatophilus sp. TF02-6]